MYLGVIWADTEKSVGMTLIFKVVRFIARSRVRCLSGDVFKRSKARKILDLCAAPGGKTTHIGSAMHQKGFLVANEIDRSVLRFCLKMLNVGQRTVVTSKDPKILSWENFPNYFDKVLVDTVQEGMMERSFAPEAVVRKFGGAVCTDAMGK